MENQLYYNQWREFTTVVLRKPGKPNYETPKAYWPITLISTMAKVLTSIVAESLSQIAEQHQLLPKNHFGGRPGQNSIDAIHYLVDKILTAWRSDKVVSVLYLDVEGAFPNVSPKRLIHNLKKRRFPTTIINFVKMLLTNRKTRLQFNDYTSKIIHVKNGIGQGDPLSMILYIFYNADILDIPNITTKEDAMGYVDDIDFIVITKNFQETTKIIRDMTTRQDGRHQWSITHNSLFGVPKSIITHYSRRTIKDPNSDNQLILLPRPVLILDGQTVQETN